MKDEKTTADRTQPELNAGTDCPCVCSYCINLHERHVPCEFECALLQRHTKTGDPDEKRGLYGKYDVRRLNDPSGKHAGCEFFVLDLKHDEFSAAALRAYADACEAKYPQLAADLRRRLNA